MKMKWILAAVLTLAGLVLLVLLVGLALPRRHRVSRTVTFRVSPGAVWQIISGPPTWRPDIRHYEELPARDGRRLWKETDNSGQTITYETLEASAPRKLVTRIADTNLPFGGTWTQELAPAGQGCTLTITEDGEVYNPIFRFVSRFIIGHSASMDAYTRALHSKLDG